MSDGNGGGWSGTLLFIAILLGINALSYLFNWGFFLF
jgi:hypothetical protein